jgi:transposase
MARTCLACASPERAAIDKALVSGEPLRNIAKRVSISAAGLLRHKAHLSQAVVKASERREERLGDNLLEEMRRVQRKAWTLLEKAEEDGDNRGAIVALREVRECLESLGTMLAKAEASKAEAAPAQPKWYDELIAMRRQRYAAMESGGVKLICSYCRRERVLTYEEWERVNHELHEGQVTLVLISPDPA